MTQSIICGHRLEYLTAIEIIDQIHASNHWDLWPNGITEKVKDIFSHVFARHLKERNMRLYFLENAGQYTGYIAMQLCGTLQTCHTFHMTSPMEYEVVSLCVEEEYQRQGQGTALMTKAIEKARKKGAEKLSLTFNPTQQRIEFYTQKSFPSYQIEECSESQDQKITYNLKNKA